MRRDVFQAIADPTRRAIINLLAQQSLNLNAVAENFHVSRPAISKHIKILTECGLVAIKQEGRERICKAKFDKLNEVALWVEQYRVFWTGKLDALDKFLNTVPANKKQTIKKNTMNNDPVIVEKVYNATIEKVWKALTNKDEMKQWYFNLDDFKPEVGFEFRFPGQGHKGEQYMHICKITEVVPFKKLQYSWRYQNYEGYSVVTFELSEEGKQTRLKLTHEGLETFPQNNADFARESFNAGWTELITVLLTKYLEKV